jgi:acyl dehydratase
MRTLLYLDDLAVGMQFESSAHTVTEEDIKRFAGEFDPQPFHLDEAAAASSLFRGLAASGWHTAAITMRMLTADGLPLANGIVGVGAELTWVKPVRPGDTLRVVSTIKEITPSKSKPHQGVVTVLSETLNGAGEVVQRLTSRVLAYRDVS